MTQGPSISLLMTFFEKVSQETTFPEKRPDRIPENASSTDPDEKHPNANAYGKHRKLATQLVQFCVSHIICKFSATLLSTSCIARTSTMWMCVWTTFLRRFSGDVSMCGRFFYNRCFASVVEYLWSRRVVVCKY